jgi:hypothetical protein
LNQLEDDSESDSDEEPTSYAPANKVSSGIDSEPSEAQEAAENLSSTLRNRNANASARGEDTATTTQSSRYGQTQETKDRSSLENREKVLAADRTEQESITESLVALARQLKLNVNQFSASLEAEKDVVDQAVSGLDKNVSGMGQASQKLGTLKKMTEGKGFFARIKLWVYILILWIVAILLVFLVKIRF